MEPVYWLSETAKGNETIRIYDFAYVKSLDDNSEFCGNLDSFLKSTIEKSYIIEGMRACQKEATGRKFAKAKESKNIRKQVLVDLHLR